MEADVSGIGTVTGTRVRAAGTREFRRALSGVAPAQTFWEVESCLLAKVTATRLAFLLIALILLAGCTQGNVEAMERENWRRHCFGRLSIELPRSADVTEVYRIEGDLFERLPDSAGQLERRIEGRTKELEEQQHATGRSMLIDRVVYPAGGQTLMSWEWPDEEDMLWADAFFMTDDPWRAYRYSGGVSASLEKRADALLRGIAGGLQGLEPEDVPGAPGFCVDGGWIAGTGFRSEMMDVSVRLPEYPGMVLSLLSSTQAEVDKETLLDRGMLSEAILVAQGATRLRKGKRSPGGVSGGEYSMASTESGQRIYTFAWEAPGKAVSVTEPYLLAEMQVFGQPVVDDDNPYEPPFEDDEEALELWDAIIDSIRLLPGA
ncbi:hypothetical protein LY625_00735 [Lysobacter sp. GX 14042]|uniref:T6SS immunity protein Tli4 family protein n=1 Tax=Lysobacter sp. GX 14042 TaxID=2907155 RepID=UPI001EE9CADE|nr:T6SS immunity protein Tli4 family protein [Lysobacter sp. GX 14042]MCE7031165.1 hypothetical protein [Lysobacter sp. GX 14042]